MNRILFAEEKSEYHLSTKDPRFEHVRGVLRMKPGDTFDVGVINGPVGKAHIETIEGTGMLCRVAWGELPEPLIPIHLLVGLPRPQTAKKMLFDAAVLGVESIHFIPTKKSDPNYKKSSLWINGEWERVLVSGAEQAFHTHIPKFKLHSNFEEGVLHWASIKDKVILDVYEGTASLSEISTIDLPLVLGIGPEGGWVKKERDLFRKYGFDLVSMGDRVMRCESALLMAVTIIFHRHGVLNHPRLNN